MQRTLFITGGSSGIGKAICELFSQHGYEVVNFDIQPCAVGKWVEVDVTQHSAFAASIKSMAEDVSPSVLICNAGKHLSANIEKTDEKEFDALMALNVKSTYTACQATLPYLKEAKDGRIILLGSDQSTIAKPNSFAYCMSKHAIAGMTKSLAIDCAPMGITVNAICPGTIDTPLYRNAIKAYSDKSKIPLSEIEEDEAAQQPVNRIGTASEVAQLALFLASAKSGFITGSLQMIDGGYTAK